MRRRRRSSNNRRVVVSCPQPYPEFVSWRWGTGITLWGPLIDAVVARARVHVAILSRASDWSIGVVKRRQIDPMPRSNCQHLLHSLLSDGPSSLRERFEAALQSESHAFE